MCCACPCGRSARASPKLGEFGRSWRNFDHIWPSSANSAPILAKSGSRIGTSSIDVGQLVRFGPHLTNFGRNWPKLLNFARSWSKLCQNSPEIGRMRSTVAKFPPNLANVNQTCPDSCQISQNFGELRSKFVDFVPTLANIDATRAKFGQHVTKFGRSRPNLVQRGQVGRMGVRGTWAALAAHRTPATNFGQVSSHILDDVGHMHRSTSPPNLAKLSRVWVKVAVFEATWASSSPAASLESMCVLCLSGSADQNPPQSTHVSEFDRPARRDVARNAPGSIDRAILD